MKLRFSLSLTLTVAALACAAWPAVAAPSADELRKLGTTLTPFGAEKAGNKDGTIPEYTGGLTTPPPGYDPKRPGWLVDPFANDKPLLRIDAKNVDKHADKLSPGTIDLIKRYPTFFVDVYPTRRTVAYPESVGENSVKNASGGRCQVINGGAGLDVSKGCGKGFPFPLPANGLEVLWNHHFRYLGPAVMFRYQGRYVKPSGEVVQTNDSFVQNDYPMYFPGDAKPDTFFVQRAEARGPARFAGQTSMYWDKVADSERVSYSYQPATRRVRLAPDLAADMPIATMGGAVLYDEAAQFQGNPSRFDWKLLGKKEIYIPYNAYKFAFPSEGSGCDPKSLLTPKHPKADCIRWELHRVWHVQATLKADKRHVYSKRDFFYDEDSWYHGLQENYDQGGRLYRVILAAGVPDYAARLGGNDVSVSMDLNSGIYFIPTVVDGRVRTQPLSPATLAPDSLSSMILKY